MTARTETTPTVVAQDVVIDDVIVYPGWYDGRTVTDQPRTVGGIVEFPKTRVLYFREGGSGVVDRDAVLARAEAVAR